MNKKGSVLIFGFMMGLTIIILALALAPAVSQSTEAARNNTYIEQTDNWNITHQGLDCGNSSISNFDRATCVATDLSLFYFIGALILIGGAFFGARFLGG